MVDGPMLALDTAIGGRKQDLISIILIIKSINYGFLTQNPLETVTAYDSIKQVIVGGDAGAGKPGVAELNKQDDAIREACLPVANMKAVPSETDS